MKIIKESKTVKDVIEDWSKELDDIVKNHPFLSFSLISTGIEFLGKCLDYKTPWNQTGMSEMHFKYAIHKLDALSEYRPFAPLKDVYDIKGDNVLKRAATDASSPFFSNATFVTEESNFRNACGCFSSAHPRPSRPINNDTVSDSINKFNSSLRKAELVTELRQIQDQDVVSARTSLDAISSGLNLSPPSTSEIDMYSQIRCGLVHSAIPGKDFILSSKVNWPIYSAQNNNSFVLDADDFLKKFREACTELFSINDQNVQTKLREEYLVVYYPDEESGVETYPDMRGYDVPKDMFTNPYTNGFSACPAAEPPSFPWFYPDKSMWY